MKHRSILIAGTFLCLTIGIGASAAWAEGPVVEREERQQTRIANGLESEQLTAKEAVKLEKGQAKVEKAREKAWADGTMTHKEKRKMTRKQNFQSKNIYRLKHNKKTA